MTRSPRLWFGAFGGMAAYALHIVGNYWLVAGACAWGTNVPLYVFTGVLLGVAIGATAVAVGLFSGGDLRQGMPGAPRHERVRFMAGLGVVLGVLSIALILFGGAANLFFDPCQGTV